MNLLDGNNQNSIEEFLRLLIKLLIVLAIFGNFLN